MAATNKFTSEAMRAVVLLIFPIFSTFAQLRTYPYEELMEASIKHPRQTEPLLQNVVYHPQYEVKTYDTVESSKLVCCTTKSGENIEETAESNNLPPLRLTNYPATEHSQTQQHKNTLLVKNLKNIFRRILLEVLLQIVRSVLNTFEDPATYQSSLTKVSNNHQSDNYALENLTKSQIKIFLQELNNHQQIKPSYGFEELLHQVSSQKEPNSQQLKNYKCEMAPVNKC